MAKTVDVINQRTGQPVLRSAKWCSDPFSRLVGLQFRRGLRPGEAIIMAKKKDSVSASSIHMFFVNFPIAVVWVNSQGRVTSAQLAQPWRPYYASPDPACYVIEAEPDLLDRVQVGDVLEFC